MSDTFIITGCFLQQKWTDIQWERGGTKLICARNRLKLPDLAVKEETIMR